MPAEPSSSTRDERGQAAYNASVETQPTPPERRLHLTLDLHADDMQGIYEALQRIADDVDNEGREERDWTSGGRDSGFHLTLTVTDPDLTPAVYYERLKDWMRAKSAAKAAVRDA